jgi:hypothetical protein
MNLRLAFHRLFPSWVVASLLPLALLRSSEPALFSTVPPWPVAPAASGVPVASDRGYTIRILPDEMQGAELLQRPILTAHLDPAENVTLTKPAMVYAAVMYKHNARTRYDDQAFAQLEKAGWTYVEDDFQTTTFQSEIWYFQVMRSRRPAGPLQFPTQGAIVFFLARP